MKIIMILIVCLVAGGSAEAIDLGELDTSFSQDGLTDGYDISGEDGYDREGSDIVIDSMGRLIIVGYYKYDLNGQELLSARIERRLADGSLDVSFDGDGYKELFLDPSASYKYRFKVILEENDAMFVAYTMDFCVANNMCQNDVIVNHYSSDGSDLGLQRIAFDRGANYSRQNDNFTDMVYLPALNRLAITATIDLDKLDDTDFGVAMLLVDPNTGALSMDNSFNTDGKNWCFFDQADPSGSFDLATAIDWDPQTDHIFIGGSTIEGNGLNSDGWNMSFCEFDLQGNLLAKWSTDILPDVFYDIEMMDDLSVVYIDNKLHLLAGGKVSGAGDFDFAVARFTKNQAGVWDLDSSFGELGNGIQSTSFELLFVGDTDDNIRELLIADDGSILVAGRLYWEDNELVPHTVVALAKYTENGILDTNWGIGHTGKAVHTFNHTRAYDFVNAIALDPVSEAIFISGYSRDLNGVKSLVAKIHNDQIFGSNFDF